MSNKKNFSLVVETENLAAAGLEDLEASLDSLKNQTFPIKNIKEVILIAAGHVSEQLRKKILKKYPWVTIHVEKKSLAYPESKLKGAKVATSKYVLFADSDVRYSKTWLKNMIETMEAQTAGTIVAGDTRVETTSAYTMSLNGTWIITLNSSVNHSVVPTHSFMLNNFAIERQLFLKNPVPFTLPLYRNNIALWKQGLFKKGYRVVRAPNSRGFHAPPETVTDWWYRLLVYGADFVALADFSVNEQGKIIEKTNIPKRFLRTLFFFPWKIKQLVWSLYILLQEDSKRLKHLPLALCLGFINCLVSEIGGIIACVNRDFVLNKISAREKAHVV